MITTRPFTSAAPPAPAERDDHDAGTTMSAAKTWDVRIHIGEHDDGTTRAVAQLLRSEIRADGTARLNPRDANVPEIGDRLAAARALQNLATHLLGLPLADIADVPSDPIESRPRHRASD